MGRFQLKKYVAIWNIQKNIVTLRF